MPWRRERISLRAPEAQVPLFLTVLLFPQVLRSPSSFLPSIPNSVQSSPLLYHLPSIVYSATSVTQEWELTGGWGSRTPC